MKKRIASAILALCLLLPVLPVEAGAEDLTSGKYGKNVTWTLDSDGLLTICGTGPMANLNEVNPDYTLYDKSRVKSVVIEQGVTNIGYMAFTGCRSLTSVTIPTSVTSIGIHAFTDCTSLTSVTIPSSVTSIGTRAFYDCRKLTSLTIQNGVGSIGDMVFEGCSSLSSVTIPGSLTSIGKRAFYGCSGLTSVTILNGVTSIGEETFSSCSSLVSVTIPTSVRSIGNRAFNGCSSLTGVIIPDGVTSIGDRVFAGCSGLTSIDIPDSVTDIGDMAFSSCDHLTSVGIPDSVTNIGEMAFSGCNGLKDVYYGGDEQGWKNITIKPLNDALENATIHYKSQMPESFTVTFNSQGGSNVTSQTLTSGGKVSKPSDPTRPGYTFGGWYKEAACNTLWDFDTDTVTEATTLYAKWTADTPPTPTQYTITFELGGGTLGSGATTLTVNADGKVEKPAQDPTRPGYIFIGWYTDASCTTVWDFSTHTVTSNTTIYAKWEKDNGGSTAPGDITVSIQLNGGTLGSGATTLTVNADGKVEKPAQDPTRPGYIFIGWYTDASCTTVWDFSTHTVTSNTTIYAKWEKDNGGSTAPGDITVSIQLNGGTLGSGVTTLTVNADGKVEKPAQDPTRPGYIFIGWYTDASCTTVWDFSTHTVTSNITLYAKWTADTSNGYTITFKTIDETGVNEFTTMRTGADGKLTGLPQFDDPNNYGFAGWYTDSNDGEKVTTDTVFTQNTDVFAHWNDYFTVTFYEDAPTYNMTIQMVQRGKKAAKPADPVKADYTFQGWYTLKRVDNDEVFDKEWNFEDVVTKNLFLCAKWEKNTTNPDDTKKTYTITFNADGGKFITGGDVVTVETDTQGKLANFPEVTRDGYDFVDWHNDQIGVAGKDTVFTSDTTLYAHWNKTGGTTTPVDPDPDKPDPPKTFTVTFDPNGGTVSPTSAATAPGGGPVTMPTPTRTGYSFDGWFTAASGGEKVLSDKTFSQNTTIYAHWTQNTTPAETRYRIYTPGSVSGGSYDVSRSTAAEGTRVTIELSPRSGYELDVLTVTNLDTGRSVPLTERYSDEYYFTMPASSVDVDISFSRVYPSGIYYDAAPPRAQPGPTAWYYSNRHICHVTNGQVPDGTPITRDMLISVLYNLTDESLLTAPSTIGSKTNNSHTWAVASNITPDIYASGLWGTDKPLSREQLSIMMFQYAVYRGCGTSQSVNISHYSDYDRVRPIAHGALSWALATGLMSSTSNVTLSPQAGITCGQTGELLYRFLTTIS